MRLFLIVVISGHLKIRNALIIAIIGGPIMRAFDSGEMMKPKDEG
jgi:hypothetical protein